MSIYIVLALLLPLFINHSSLFLFCLLDIYEITAVSSQLKNIMESNYDVFYCTVCQVCKNPPTSDAKFCSGCKLVQYCCGSHQKEDWLYHKDFCKSVKDLLKKTGNDHVFKEVFGFTGHNLEGWNELRFSVMKVMELIMGRSLTFVETQMLLFPPLCNFCRCYEQNKMYSCIGCNNVMYCSVEHQQKDRKHKDVCKHLFLCYKIDMQRYFNQSTAYNFKMLGDLKVFKKFPESIEKILQPHNQNLSSEELLLSEPLSYFMTLAFVVHQVKKNSCNCLTVHIVGADGMEFQALEALPLFLKLLPRLTNLKIVMIGPNLPKHFSVPSWIQDICSLYLVRDKLYHEYIHCSNFIQPDVIAIFNCGFSEFTKVPEQDKWKDTLPVIFSLSNSTVVLTSYSAKESRLDLNRLCDSGKRHNFDMVMECKMNPYGSLYPHRDWEIPNDGVFYVNKYMSVLKV